MPWTFLIPGRISNPRYIKEYREETLTGFKQYCKGEMLLNKTTIGKALVMTDTPKKVTGKFSLIGGREVFGYLHICGTNSKIELFDDKEFLPAPDAYSYIRGESHEGSLLTLLQGTLIRTGSHFTASADRKHYAEVFPHFVAIGSAQIPQYEQCIENISFAMEDATAVFYDFDAFSTVLDTKPFLPLLRNHKAKYRHVEFGDRPIIAYFTGKYEIAVVDTVFGEVRAEHRPSFSSGGPGGVRMDNQVVVTLTPPEPVGFEEAIERLSVLLRFFGMIMGREQPLHELTMTLADQPERSLPVRVYRSFTPTSRNEGDPEDSHRPHPADVLVSSFHDAEEYSTVLRNYLASDSKRQDGRERLQYLLKDNSNYTIDRLIAAANAFDILPDSAYPEKIPVNPELAAAKEEARQLFRGLPDSFERSAVLASLGRIGHLSLKHKIKHRVTSTGIDQHFPRIVDVLEEAVNCRNHYVHGAEGRIDYSANIDVVCFFTDALEFAFVASDLIDVGWNFSSWKAKRAGFSHPFGEFALNYTDQLRNFEELLDKRKPE